MTQNLGVYKIDWDFLSQNPAISLNNIITHPEYPWDWYTMSTNLNMTIEFAMEYHDKLEWYRISENSGITMDDITNCHGRGWVYPNITPDFVMANFKRINFKSLFKKSI